MSIPKFSSKHCTFEIKAPAWDATALGFPVLDLVGFRLSDGCSHGQAATDLREWLKQSDAKMMACRLCERQLAESRVLESAGFNFIEMMISPVCTQVAKATSGVSGIYVRQARREDLGALRSIAARAFGYERFHQDSRIDTSAANLRYANWVDNALEHPTQQLYCVSSSSGIVAVFVTEVVDDTTVYWHLTALDPDLAGQGLGESVWRSMIAFHKAQGLDRLVTKIAVRNTVVMNLYAKLGFRFEAPEMTFHWIRSGELS